jgi:hypothetical protein
MELTRRLRTKPAVLLPSLQSQLSAYGIAAGAAGVSLLALTPAAEAKVVYTPANELIDRDGSYKLDLNHDGLIDYIIAEHSRPDPPYGTSQSLSVRAAAGNQVNCPSAYCISGDTYAAALSLGTPIGNIPGRGWLGKEVRMALEGLSRRGGVSYEDGWANVHDRYLGLRFQINGETHFGWARLTVHFHGGPPKERTGCPPYRLCLRNRCPQANTSGADERQ